MKKKTRIIVIVGPTASGKSECAVVAAKKWNGEIISADSRQIYKGLMIGTAKVRGSWTKKGFMYKGVRHFCIDAVSPKKVFTAADFKIWAAHAIDDISSRGKMPIVTGGTGLWIDTLIYDLNLPQVRPNPLLRRRLEKKPVSELFMMLKKRDPRRAKTIESKNPRRPIRAIEIAEALGQVPDLVKKDPYHAVWIGISPDEKILRRRIALRARMMVRRGLVAETKKLLLKGVSKKRVQEFGFEYAAALDAVEKKISHEGLVRVLSRETIKYAARQMRWFVRNKETKWFDGPKKAEAYLRRTFSR